MKIFEFEHKFIENKLQKEKEKQFDINSALKIIMELEGVLGDVDNEKMSKNLVGFDNNSFKLFGEDLKGKYFLLFSSSKRISPVFFFFSYRK